MKITRTKERIKQTAEVFTPENLVNDILDNLEKQNPTLFSDPTKTFLDNSCGNGNFLVEVLKRKLLNGIKPIPAIASIYGIDIMSDNIEECKYRLIKVVASYKKVSFEKASEKLQSILDRNIVCADGLTYEFN